MLGKDKKAWNFENLADDLKAYLFMRGKKRVHLVKVPEEHSPSIKNIQFDEIHISAAESHNVSLEHVLKIEEAVKTYKRIGKIHLANSVREFTEYLVNDPHLIRSEKNELVEKFGDLIKEISTPEIYQKTRLIGNLYPEVKKLIAKNDELECRWRDLESALAASKLK